jgi:hypothetical protein
LNKSQNLEKWVSSKSFNSLPEAIQLDELENRLNLNRDIAELRITTKIDRLRDASTKNILDGIRKDTAERVPKRSSQNLFNIGQQ